MDKHVVVGAGPVGSAVARELVAQGVEEVVLVSRSGRGAPIEGVVRVALDVADADALTRVGEGASALYNCVNPPSYDVWSTWWPPVEVAFLAAAEATGAVLATASCLYPYGEVDAPMTEQTPDAATGAKGRLRAEMWARARAAHEAGRLRAVEVRGSDYVGPGVTSSHLAVVAPRAMAERPVRVFGSADVPHTFTDVRDMARTLVAVAARPSTHGRVWHAPSTAPRTQREAVADLCAAAGVPAVRVRTWPRAMLSVGGLVVPFLREMRETAHQFERPWVMDSAAAQRELGLAPTPWEDSCAAMVAPVDADGADIPSAPRTGTAPAPAR